MDRPPQPIPPQAITYLAAAMAHCHTACISGSSPLTQYLRDLTANHQGTDLLPRYLTTLCKTIWNNDIDIFVPQYIGQVNLLEQAGPLMSESQYIKFRDEVVRSARTETDPFLINHIARYRYGLDSYVHPNRRPDRYGQVKRVVRAYDVALWDNETRLEIKIQVIIVRGVPKRDQSWWQYVTSEFDVNVARCTADVDFKRKRVKAVVFEKGVLEKVLAGRFDYTIHPEHTFLCTLKRIHKYFRKGFQLNSVGFSDYCSQSYRDYMRSRFLHLQAPRVAERFLTANGMNPGLAQQIAEYHIAPLLDLKTGYREALRVTTIVARSNLRRPYAYPFLRRHRSRHIKRRIEQAVARRHIRRWLLRRDRIQRKMKEGSDADWEADSDSESDSSEGPDPEGPEGPEGPMERVD